MAIEDIFKNFGLTLKQIQVLLASLELGSQPVSVIAKKINLNRTTVYALFNGLAKLGFVNKYIKLGVQYFNPLSPEGMIDLARRKKEEFARHEHELQVALPELAALYNPFITRSKVAYFEGPQGVRNVLEDILMSRGDISTYRCALSWSFGQTSNLMKEFDRRRVARKIKMYVIAHGADYSYFSDEPVRRFGQVKFISDKRLYFKNETYIYDNKVAVLSFVSGSMFGVIIESDENHKTQKSIFDFAWRASSKNPIRR